MRQLSAPLVLVVDDDRDIREALGHGLTLEGFAVETAAGGGQALEAITANPPAVIVLDVTMPKPDGVEVTKRLRGEGNDVPICILSARDGIEDRVAGLEAGADDYLVKPFALEELVARLQALMRRRPPPDGDVPRAVGSLRVDVAARRAWIEGAELELTAREFDLLEAFARHPGVVLSRTQLLEQVWGYTFDVKTNVVDVFVGYLRRKLEDGDRPRILKTVRGRGFVLRA